MRIAALLSLALAAACATVVPGLVPARVAVDEVPPELAREVAAARLRLDRGDARAALAAVAAIGEAGRGVVDLQRLRQDALRQRGRLGLLRAEAMARVAAEPNDPIAHYLLGRVSTGDAMLAAFRRAAELAPESVWPWLGEAYALREVAPEVALAIYERLYEASDRHPAVAVAYASSLRANGRLEPAMVVYEQLTRVPELTGVGELGLAQSLFARGGAVDRQRGWQALLLALAARPFDPGVQSVVRELLRLGIADDQVQQCFDVLRARPERLVDFARGVGLEVAAELLMRTGQPHAVLRLLDGAAVSAAQPALRRLQRRIVLQLGDGRRFLAMLAADLPRALLDDEGNQVRGLWLSVLDGPWPGGDPFATPDAAGEFASALTAAGLLNEAEFACELAIARHRLDDAPAARLVGIRDEVRAELAFEGGLRRLLYDGYVSAGVGDLDQLLAKVRELAVATLGRDVTGVDARFQVPLVGEMLDPFRSGLCEHLARYNRHLAIGRRSGGVVEGLMLTRLSLRDLEASSELPVQGRCREVIGVERSVRSLSGVLGGDLAGVALLNHYIVDHDAVAEWAASVARRRRIVREDGDAIRRDPVPEATAALDPLDSSWRLGAAIELPDGELDAAVLDVIRRHERRHLVDSFHYLPFEANVWRGLGLLLNFGLSPSAIEAEMERRAELAALATCNEPRLVLAHIAEFVVQDDLSPHVRGFSRLAAEVVEALIANGLAPEDAAIARWDRLDANVVRAAAAKLLEQLP